MLAFTAGSLLASGGPGAAIMGAAGAAAEVSCAAPCRHFKDKNDLLHAIAVAILKNIENAMERGAADSTMEGSELYQTCIGYVQEAIN